MLKKLHLSRFKNFSETQLILGPLTLLVGENASGKSNVRDAFRFLHGISRGYTLPDIMGEKWGEGGVLQWNGIRGGIREIAFQGADTFALEAEFTVNASAEASSNEPQTAHHATYRIEVNLGANGEAPRVVDESLFVDALPIFELRGPAPNHSQLFLNVPTIAQNIIVSSQQPALSQLYNKVFGATKEWVQAAIDAFSDMRFLELNPAAMRRPSLPWQTTLGDQGENLASVLQRICAEPNGKETLVQWIEELTPMDANDFDFVSDATGKILLMLIERNGQRTSAYSASDGTLRFLAMIAALLGPKPARFYFFEELDNGLHPARRHLLLELIEQRVARSNMQIVATTHSSQLLNVLNPCTLDAISLVYRLEERPDAQIKRILDIPDARHILQEHELASLHAMGWLEDTVSFAASEESSA